VYISKITLDNFKSFKGYGHEIDLNKGLNFFVGDNNTGKTTVLAAVNFITEKKMRDAVISKGTKDDDYVAVTMIIRGEFTKYIASDASLKKFLSYVQTDDKGEFLQVQRSSKYETIKQSKKDVELTIEKIRLYNPDTKQYENPSGIDNPFRALFSTQFVWADDMPSDYMDFGSTKLCGKLINATASAFFKSEKWDKFEKAHREAFTEGDDSLSSAVKELASDLEKVISEQYGSTKVSFQFTLPEASGFIKSGDIVLDDDGILTAANAKGTGMQRALALAVIQVFARVSSKMGGTVPIVFLLDEPETFLHPRAQSKLLTALDKISETNQIFISTHSPYLLKHFRKTNHDLFIFSKNKGMSTVDSSVTLSTFGTYSPTISEINYFAFGVTTSEFHNELYGFVQAKAVAIDPKNDDGKKFEKYLTANGLSLTKQWVQERGGVPQPAYDTTIQTYIRHSIHHPENKQNAEYTEAELEASISELLNLI
jgi:predicted ATP-dependent endonuclease of OLD family